MRIQSLALLWLWCWPAATALIRPLGWEPPYAVGAALKKKKIYIYIYVCVCVCVCIFRLFSLLCNNLTGYYKILSTVSCAKQEVFGGIYFIHSRVDRLSPNSSSVLPPAFPFSHRAFVFCLWVYFCFVHKVIYHFLKIPQISDIIRDLSSLSD